jgi:hypothetical protein
MFAELRVLESVGIAPLVLVPEQLERHSRTPVRLELLVYLCPVRQRPCDARWGGGRKEPRFQLRIRQLRRIRPAESARAARDSYS